MYFHTVQGKQSVDFRGDLLLTHNTAPIKSRNKSAAPRQIKNIKHIDDIARMGVWRKLRASRLALAFIWGSSQELTREVINEELTP